MRERYMQPKANRVDRALLERPAVKSTGENSCGVDMYEVVVRIIHGQRKNYDTVLIEG
jgi:hypothetical protein